MARKLSFSVESILSGGQSTPGNSQDHVMIDNGRFIKERRYSCPHERMEGAANVTYNSPSSSPPVDPYHESINQDEEEGRRDYNEDGDISAKSRKGRMRFTPKQVQILEQRFREQHYLLPADRKTLATLLSMSERQVKTWFQNKRAQCKRSRAITSQVFHPFLSYNIPAASYCYRSTPPHLSFVTVDQSKTTQIIQCSPSTISHPYQLTDL
jgi:hypothetical protein